MKFISIGDLPNEPELLRRMVADEAVTLTSNGKPFALVVRLTESEDPALLERLIGQARAQRAVSRIREQARANGTDEPGSDDIDREIRGSRSSRPR